MGLNPQHTNAVQTGTLAPPLRQRWSVTLDGQVSAPLIAGGRVFVLTRRSGGAGAITLRALDSQTGSTLWQASIATSEFWGAIAFDANRVYVACSNGKTSAYDATTGAFLWSRSLSYGGDAPPVARDGLVWVGAGNGLNCLNGADGSFKWRAPVRNGSRSAPALDSDGKSYVSYSCPNIYSIDANGSVVWSSPDGCSGGGGSTPSLYDGKLWVREGKFSGSIYRTGYVLDASNGADLGSLDSSVIPAFYGNKAFTVIGANSYMGGTLRAISTSDFSAQWTWSDGGALTAPLVLNGHLFVGSSQNKLYALNPATGAPEWTASLPFPAVTSSEYSNTSPYVAMAAGEDLLVVPAANSVVAFEAATPDTIAPVGYCTSLPDGSAIRVFPGAVWGQVTDNVGGIGVDRVEMAITRVRGGVRQYFTNINWGDWSNGNDPKWSATPTYFPSTLSGSTWTANTSYFDSYLTSENLEIRVVSFDRAGNRGERVSSLNLDKDSPTVIFTAPTRPTNALTQIAGTITDNPGGVGVRSLKISLMRDDGCSYSDCGAYWDGASWVEAPEDYTKPPVVPTKLNCLISGENWVCTSSLPPASTMPEHWYKIIAYPSDNLGNTSSNPNSGFGNTFSFWLDKTAPQLQFGAPVPAPNAAGWNNSDISLPYTASDAVGVASAAPGSPLAFSAQGRAQTQTVTVTDLAGNVANFVSPAIHIDKNAPTTTAQLTPATAAVDSAIRVILSATDAGDSGIAGVFYTLDDGAATSYTAEFNIAGVGTHTLKFWSVDVAGNTETAQTQTIVIQRANSAPVALAATVATDQDTALAITLSATDSEGDALTYRVMAQPTNGILSGAAPNLTYTPNARYRGADSLQFVANDGALDSAAATISITVRAVSHAPVAVADAFETPRDTVLRVAAPGVLVNDYDLDGETLSAAIAAAPTNGQVALSADGSFVYTPDVAFEGSDSFTYVARNSAVNSLAAKVTLTVKHINAAPVAQSAAISTPQNAPVAVALGATDPEGDALTYRITTQPAHGILSGSAPNLTYTPTSGYLGADSFGWTASDGALQSNVATVSVTVTAIQRPPVGVAANVSLFEDLSLNITIKATSPDNAAINAWSIVTAPSNGTLSGTAPNLKYTPAANFFGNDSFAFKARDARGLWSDSAPVTIAVTPVNDAPSFALKATSVSVSKNSGAYAALIAQAISPGPGEAGQSVAFTVTNSNNRIFATQPAISPDGTLTFAPKKNTKGSASVSVTLKDNGGTANSGKDSSATLRFTIYIN